MNNFIKVKDLKKYLTDKVFWSRIYILLTLVVIIIFGIVNNEVKSFFGVIAGMDITFISVIVLVTVLYLLFEGGIIHYLLRSQKTEIKLPDSIKIGIIGLYYCYITPSSTGGQPAQAAYLKRHNIPMGGSIAAMFLKFFAYQTAFMLCTTASLIYMHSTIASMGNTLLYFSYFGLFMNGLWLVVIPLLFSRRCLRFMCKVCIKLTNKIDFLKKRNFEEKINKFEADFSDYSERFRKNKKEIILSVVFSIPQAILQMSVLYFVYRALGNTEAGFVEITAMQHVLQASVCFMPMPGASGAQEIGFSAFMAPYFSESNMFASVLTWRFFTYYIFILLGAVVIIVDQFTKPKNKTNKDTNKTAA